jgi:fibronectin type 3 domain-containing protein
MSYESVILTDSPDGCWPLDDASGTSAHDVSTSNLPGTYTAPFTLGQTGQISGHTAVHFGDGGKATFDGKSYAANANYSLEASFYLSQVIATDLTVSLISVGVPNVVLFDSARIAVREVGGNGDILLVGSGVQLGWNHLILTVDSGKVFTLYLNGTQVGSHSGTATYTDSSIKVGGNTGVNFGYADTFQYAVHYPTALSSTQVTNHYNAFITQPPGIPTGLTVIPGDTQASLSWTATTGATSYNIYRSTTSGAEVQIQTGVSTNSYNDTGLTNGTTYYYKINAANTAGESGLSSEVSVVPTSVASLYTVVPASSSLSPGATDVFTFTPNGNTTVTVTPSVTGGGSFSPSTITFDGAGSSETSTFTAPTSGSTVTISYTNSGSLTDPGDTTLTILTPSISAPTATLVLAGAVVLTCPMATGGAPPYRTYQFQRSDDDSTFTNIGTGDVHRKYTDITVSASTTYYYRVLVTDDGGGSNWSSSISIATPASTAGNTIQWLPDEVSHATDLAVANDVIQWQSLKSYLDSRLNEPVSSYIYSNYQGSDLDAAANNALAYISLVGTDSTTAQTYADKAIAAMLNGATGIQRTFYSCIQFNARGDGTTTTFTIPNSDYLSASLKVFLVPVVTETITKGSDNGQDSSNLAGAVFIKVSNTNDGPSDYIKDTDWQQDTFNYREDKIDWSLAQSQPITGSTYYLTSVDLASTGNKLTSGFTVSGNTITFDTPPATNQAVCLEYVYGTHAGNYSTLAYQQTTSGNGGVSNAWVDGPGYVTRSLQYIAYAYDWMWNYPGFSWALKAQIGSVLVKWSDFARDTAYAANAPASNYGAGHIAMRTAIALALKNRESVNSSRLLTEVTDYYTNLVKPTLAAPTGTVGSNKDGFWSEGWNYGAWATENIILAALGAEEAGLYTPTDVHAWSNEVIRALIIQQPTQTTILDAGDGYQYPEPFPSKAILYFTSYYATDTTLKSYANYMIQNYTGSQISGFRDVMFRDPSATAASWGSSLPTAYKFSGTGVIISRKAWDYTSTWLAFHAGNLTGAAHQPYGQGSYEVWRGGDDLIPLVDALTEVQSIQGKSQYGSGILVDDFGAGYMTYPSTNQGPAMGVWYSGPNGCQITKFEDTTGYSYWAADYGAAYGHDSSGVPNPTTELNRSQLYVRGSSGTDYLITHDRVTTVQATFLKQYQFPINPASTIDQTGTSVTITRGTSTLFSKVFSDVPLTTSLNTLSINGGTNNCKQFTAAPTTNDNVKVRYRTAMQISPSSVVSPDTMTDILSTDTVSEGVMIGNTVTMFGVDGAISGDTSYSHTATNGETVTHYVTDLQADTTYYLTGADQASTTSTSNGVASFTSTGTGSSQAIALSLTPPSGVPAAPTGLSVTAGDAQVDLSWTASAGATSYNIYRSTSSGTEVQVHTGVSTNSYSDTGLTNGTTYYYKISAVNAFGESSLSSEDSATPEVPGSAPSSPTGLSATAGDAQIDLSWTVVAGATSYNIYRSTSSGTEVQVHTGVSTNSYSDTGLTNGTTYYYKISAVNAFGESSLSSEDSTTPVEAAVYTLVAPAPNYSMTAVTSGEFAVTVSGELLKDLVIIPHDDGHHGTFSPRRITLTNASPSTTFTYTPRQWGTFSISTTNDGGLVDPPSVEYIGLFRDANEGIHPKITFRVKTAFDFALESAPLFDRATQTYQLGLTTYYIPEHPIALRPGDTFTLYGVEAIRVKRNHIGVPNSFLEIVSEV